MKKWNKMCFIFICLSLLSTCSACTTEANLPESTVCFFNDGPTRDKMDQAFLKAGDTAAKILFGNWIPNEYPSFSIQNAEGQTLTLEGEKAEGSMQLFRISGFGPIEASYAWRYTVPSSERYTITPDPKENILVCSVDNNVVSDLSNKIEYFYFQAVGDKFEPIDYSLQKTIFSGRNMEYTLSLEPIEASHASRSVYLNLTGSGESRLTIQVDHNDLLIQAKEADAKITSSDFDEDQHLADVELGTCPAGKWTRLSYNGTEWILTEEPPSPRPWIALGGGILLAAAASFLLYRRRKVKLPAFPEDPEHDTAEHPPEAP